MYQRLAKCACGRYPKLIPLADGTYYYACRSCGETGPCSHEKQGARRGWNDYRPDPTQASGFGVLRQLAGARRV